MKDPARDISAVLEEEFDPEKKALKKIKDKREKRKEVIKQDSGF